MTSQAKALLAARAACEKQAEQVVVIDVRALSSVTDFFLICTASSGPQLTALIEHIEAALERHGTRVGHIEGASTTAPAFLDHEVRRWILMDCGDVVVHLFDPPARAFYRLEDLWADAPRLEIPRPSASVDTALSPPFASFGEPPASSGRAA